MTRPTPPEVEVYLKEVERELDDLAVVTKSEILLEVRQEILDLLAQTQKSAKAVLASVGPPSQSARRRRMERGLGPGPHARADRAWLKWMVAVFVAGGLAIFVSLWFLFRSLMPLVDVDEATKKVSILGGRVVIDPEKADITIGGKSLPMSHFAVQSSGSGTKVRGFAPLGNEKTIRIRAKSGRFSFRPSTRAGADDEGPPARLSYACDLREGASESRFRDAIRTEGETLVMSLDEETGTGNCAFLLPKGPALDIQVESGIVEMAFLHQGVRARVDNGMILFAAEKPEDYSIKARVTRGLVTLTQGERAGAPFSADLEVTNGSINQIR